ncbi:Spy/CpxP family protein refolding chaperone [Reyranella sp.]|uniref:Spy/CpxP family protein refolding chaperone n=1 Tax=Reyranella sp. TaxID=1929291 RepID=UPI003BA996FB
MSFRSLVLPTALVLAAGFAFTTPASAFDLFEGDEAVELAQATPPAPPPPAGPRGERAHGGERGERADRSFSPRSMCLDMTARRIGDRAYLKARLELKPDQMTAWNAFEKVADEASAKSMARCQTLPTEMKERPTYLERLTLEEDVMKARIATIEAVKPSLTALVAVLTPEQKALLDRPRAGFAHHGHMGMGRPGPR